MTELTKEQLATLKRAQEREGKTMPGPWLYVRDFDKDINTGIISLPNKCDLITVGLTKSGDACMNVRKIYDANAIVDAPNLQDLAIAQAKIIAELEAEIDRINAKHKAFFDEVWPMIDDIKRSLRMSQS